MMMIAVHISVLNGGILMKLGTNIFLKRFSWSEVKGQGHSEVNNISRIMPYLCT